MANIYNNGCEIARTDTTGKFVVLSIEITSKNKQLIELLNKSAHILKKIKDNNLSINIDSAKYNLELSEISPPI